MKKMLKSALALAMGAVMLMPVTAFAAEDEPTLISTQEVALSPSGANTRSAETKEFTLSYRQTSIPGCTLTCIRLVDNLYPPIPLGK